MADPGFPGLSDPQPSQPPRSRRSRALRLLAIPLSTVLAVGSMVAGAATAPSVRSIGVRPANALAAAAARGTAAGPVVGWTSRPAVGPNASLPSTVRGQQAAHRVVPVANFRSPRRFYVGWTAHRTVALTFDDGWNAKNGRMIVDILVREHVPATFFVNGMYVAQDVGLWREIAADGSFVVGNHTYLHRDVTKLSEFDIVTDLRRNARTWLAVTGKPMSWLFRPPYGTRNAATDLAAAKAGYPDVIMWNRDTRDWARISDAQMIRNGIGGGNGTIILMHIGPDATPRILGAIIANYRARGFTFVTVPVMLPRLPVAKPVVPTVPASAPVPPRPAVPPTGMALHGAS